MKRMHLHVSVDDMTQSVGFYSHLFGTSPTVSKPDYAKWMLDDPLVNFAISKRGGKAGLDHIGIQVEHASELEEIKQRLEMAELSLVTDAGTTCCYAKSDKHWVQDPSGIAWETYRTLDSAPTFSGQATTEPDAACCMPAAQKVQFATSKKCCP
jgi:hypothetical protein